MKITHIETLPVLVPLTPRLAIKSARGYHTASPFLFVKIHTDKEITGLGEVSCTPVWSGEDNVTAGHYIQNLLAPALIGQDPRNIETCIAILDSLLAENLFTKSGIEMALWDILGKVAGLPLYRLLGGAVRETVPTKFSISGLEPDKAAEIAHWAYSLGFRTMKVKVGKNPTEDIARVRAVRDAVGSEVRLGVDANGGWSVRDAVHTLNRLAECSIYFAEQPVSPQDPAWMAEVRRNIGVPVMADESVFNLSQALALVRAEAADIFSVYVGKGGGIGAARKMAAVAEAAGLTCTVGSNLELGVASAAMTHLAKATRGIDAETFPCDIIGPLYYETDLLKNPLPIQGGMAQCHELPGLGVELDDKAVSRYACR
ncbi:MAG: mandelate racemase/muconate lactonizing protein [Armatimonadetes bacterium]|nr:mandelate racemase/muconate lactonizing protein [Armatimonadota bacterium]